MADRKKGVVGGKTGVARLKIPVGHQISRPGTRGKTEGEEGGEDGFFHGFYWGVNLV